jgi:CRP-like cAMP-binding protein
MNNLISRTNDYGGKYRQIKFHNVKSGNARRKVEAATAVSDLPIAEVFPIKRLLNNRILSSLPDSDFERLLPDLEPVTLSAGKDLCKPDEQFDFVYFPDDAVLSQLQILANGNSTEVAAIGKEGIVGLRALFAIKPPNYWTEILIGGTALRIKTERLKIEFKRGGALQDLLLNFANEKMVQTAQRIVCHNHHFVEERLSNWLLMLLDRAAYNQLPLTQDQIARHLGVHRPGITLAALSLREKGIIDYCRGSLSVVNREGLEQLSCECYSMVKENLFNA